MADRLNQARALRLAEIVNDYRTLLVHILQQQIEPPEGDHQEEGYVVMRECIAAAQRLMSSSYNPSHAGSSRPSNDEAEKAELKRVITDASARRFQAHKIYLHAAAAKRWALYRSGVLRGKQPTAVNAAQLRAADVTLQQELAQVTDRYIVADLRVADQQAGHWLDEDPSLETIRCWIQQYHSVV